MNHFLRVEYYHNPYLNIVTINGRYISTQLAKKYSLVPDIHNNQANWYKIVVMEHVTQGILDCFIMDLKAQLVIPSIKTDKDHNL